MKRQEGSRDGSASLWLRGRWSGRSIPWSLDLRCAGGVGEFQVAWTVPDVS